MDGFGKVGEYYVVFVVVLKFCIYEIVKKLRGMGGSGVLTFLFIYVFDEELFCWNVLMVNFGFDVIKYEYFKVM